MRFRWLISAQCPFRMRTRLGSSRRFDTGWLHGRLVGFTTPELHQQGSAFMSPISWSSHKVKRSVSASFAGEVFMMGEGLAECEWISGVLESAVYQDYEPSLHRRKIDILARRARYCENVRQLSCVTQDTKPPHSTTISRKGKRVWEPIRRVRFTASSSKHPRKDRSVAR